MPSFDSDVERIGTVCERERLGVTTAAIAAAARHRGIPVRRVAGLSLLRLGYGCHRQLVWAALTSQTSAVGVDVAADKQLTKQLIAAAGIPVAEGIAVRSADEAGGGAGRDRRPGRDQAARRQPGRQPDHRRPHGRRGSRCLRARRRTSARPCWSRRSCPGTDYRVLVIDGQVAAAAQLRPASVTGDGVHTIGQLVAAARTPIHGAAPATRASSP